MNDAGSERQELEAAVAELARRVRDGDLDALSELLAFRGLLDDAIREVAAGQHANGHTWAAIGAAVGVTRQAAQQRWGTH